MNVAGKIDLTGYPFQRICIFLFRKILGFYTWIVKLNKVLCNIMRYVAYVSHIIIRAHANTHPLIFIFLYLLLRGPYLSN